MQFEGIQYSITQDKSDTDKFHRGTNGMWTLIGFQIFITVQGNVGQWGGRVQKGKSRGTSKENQVSKEPEEV